MKKILLSIGVMIAFVLGANAYAATNSTTKVGVIDIQQIMQQAPQVAAIKAQMKKEFSGREAKLVAARKSLENKLDQFNKNSSVMKENARKAMQKEIAQDEQSLRQETISFQQALLKAQTQALESLMTTIKAKVAQVAQKGGYNLVLAKSAVAYSANNTEDLTQQVIKALK